MCNELIRSVHIAYKIYEIYEQLLLASDYQRR